MKGFKAFLLRGNVVDLAVAVVIGAAFTKVINSIVDGIINPVVGAFGTQDLNAYSSCLKGTCQLDKATGKVDGILIQWGTVLGAVLSFVITAAVVYFLIVLPMNHFMKRYMSKKDAPVEVVKEPEISEVEILGEIRDLLVAQRG
ncbi:large conductance mechanosensitive channel protein MscL [Streptacidiphilus rugosus]|uniref:large conductance mechanosensitive channel protein MscL n=1 Tax=Streptacidiphilus rugosus TaxID=405783 RepID=UPI00056A276C|nr:large conductance mechanosensitive channel protein MscL [Streptacidiphilus rugosus]